MPGPMCCLLGVCCYAPLTAVTDPAARRSASEKRVKALAQLIQGAGDDDPESIAEHILMHVGIVPLGMDVAIVESYRPLFKELAAQGSDL